MLSMNANRIVSLACAMCLGVMLGLVFGEGALMAPVLLIGSGGALARGARGPNGNERRSIMNILTPRELEVLRLLASGCSYWQAAMRLGISPHTVVSHVERLSQAGCAYRGLRGDARRGARAAGNSHDQVIVPRGAAARSPRMKGSAAPREIDILRLISRGYHLCARCGRLGLSAHTVASHRRSTASSACIRPARRW